MMEPWDGPASILFSDGDIMGAVLDRNGLRPSRYYITDDRLYDPFFRSRCAGYRSDEYRYVRNGCVPARCCLSTRWKAEVIDDEELKERYASRQPYGEWLDDSTGRA
ncbi:MAG: hypothetical protein ACLTSZ_08940 [Lachnospiraceae bacterium]